MIRSEYCAHAAMRDAIATYPRAASVRALYAIQAARRKRAERIARLAFVVIGAAIPFAIFAAATAA